MDLTGEVLIRELKKEDADQVSRIQASITQTPVTIDFNKIVEDRVKNAESANFVAEYEGKIVGFMISYILLGGFGIEKSAWIAMFGVDPKFMGQGIGGSPTITPGIPAGWNGVVDGQHPGGEATRRARLRSSRKAKLLLGQMER